MLYKSFYDEFALTDFFLWTSTTCKYSPCFTKAHWVLKTTSAVPSLFTSFSPGMRFIDIPGMSVLLGKFEMIYFFASI